MKKFYVTVVALAIMTSSFAQEAIFPVKQIQRNNQAIVPVTHNKLLNQSKGISGSYWFSYPETLADVEGARTDAYDENGELYYKSTLQSWVVNIAFDTIVPSALWPESGSVYDTASVLLGMGQVFAFNTNFWHDGAIAAANYSSVAPDMTTATTYSVDSVGITYSYSRGKNVAPSVVDTLVINVLSNLTERTGTTGNLPYGGLVISGQNWISYADIPYDIKTLSVTEFAGSHLQVIKQPLALKDTTPAYNVVRTKTFPVKDPITSIDGKSLLVFYTFKPGNADTLSNTAFMGQDVSFFTGLYYEDIRPGYISSTEINDELVPQYHQELLDERNTSLGLTKDYYDWELMKGKLLPLSLFAGELMRPSIYVHVICDNCSWTGIKEMSKKNITIQPNPATSNFTVDLGAAGKSTVEMFNIVGQKVYSTTTTDASITVNVNDFKSGVYMLKINQNGQIYTSKVVVK